MSSVVIFPHSIEDSSVANFTHISYAIMLLKHLQVQTNFFNTAFSMSTDKVAEMS